jgi:hypothetical protein
MGDEAASGGEAASGAKESFITVAPAKGATVINFRRGRRARIRAGAIAIAIPPDRGDRDRALRRDHSPKLLNPRAFWAARRLQ